MGINTAWLVQIYQLFLRAKRNYSPKRLIRSEQKYLLIKYLLTAGTLAPLRNYDTIYMSVQNMTIHNTKNMKLWEKIQVSRTQTLRCKRHLSQDQTIPSRRSPSHILHHQFDCIVHENNNES